MQSQINSISNYPVRSVSIRMPHPMRWFSVAIQALGVLRQRRQLTTMSNSQLTDIGITREQAMIEAARPFWDLPAN